jgi:hypothetical protein
MNVTAFPLRNYVAVIALLLNDEQKANEHERKWVHDALEKPKTEDELI